MSFCQSLSPVVYASTGDYYQTESYSLSITIGEPVIDTYISSENVLTSGFQQGDNLVPLFMVWTGIIDEDWNKPDNWNFTRIPGNNDDVVIPETAVNMPVINISGRYCRDIIIEKNAIVTVNPGITFTIYGNVSIKGE